MTSVPRDDELAAIAAEEEALTLEREAYLATVELDAKVEEARRRLADKKAIFAAEQEHGEQGRDIGCLDTPGGVVIVKRPHMATFRKFQDKPDTKSKDVLDLVTPCVVYPPKADFGALLEKYPAVLVRAGDVVCGLAGARSKELSGKS
jgi:hypothetical protein